MIENDAALNIQMSGGSAKIWTESEKITLIKVEGKILLQKILLFMRLRFLIIGASNFT